MARAGIDRETGRLLEGWDHCSQSIAVVLTTRIGARVMRRAFGSTAKELQDRNPDPRTLLALYVSIAEALRLWEPGFRLKRIVPERLGADGIGVFTLVGVYYPRGHLGDWSIAEDRSASFANDNLRGWRVAA